MGGRDGPPYTAVHLYQFGSSTITLEGKNDMKVSWRKNVLVLVGAGYAIIFFVFLMLLFKGGMKVSEAYDIINGPVMALIGGSLAIAKDLINADDESRIDHNPDDDTDKTQEQRPGD